MFKSKTKISGLVKSVLVGVALISIQSICHADEYEKNGLPCVKEICIGDSVDSLENVKWDKVDTKVNTKNWNYSLYAKSREDRKSKYRGSVKNLSEYIGLNKFDSLTVKHLTEVLALCEVDSQGGLVGSYMSKDGNPTSVTIQLAPSAASSNSVEQKWTVVSIKRKYSIKSNQQRDEVSEALNQRYGHFKSYGDIGHGTVDFRYDELQLSLVSNYTNIRERMTLHPSCGGTAKINVD